MANKNKLTVITVVAIAPKNYKPRKSTFRFAVVTEKMTPAIRSKYEEKATCAIKEQLDEQNPGISIEYAAMSETTTVVGCLNSED